MRTLGDRSTSRPVKLDVHRIRIRLHLATNNRETAREPSDCLGCEIWVRLGCNKNSRGLLEAPKVAISAVELQLVTSERCHGKVASSRLVVPAIYFKRVSRLSPQPMWVQKGAFLHPFCTPFSQLAPLSRARLLGFHGERWGARFRIKNERQNCCLRSVLCRRDRLRVDI
jgi:hypothetical protein